MWTSLIAGLLGVSSPSVDLPYPEQLRPDVVAYADRFGLDPQRVRVSNLMRNNPSPLLTRVAGTVCHIHINHDRNAQALWSYLMDHPEPLVQDAFVRFAMGHELTHCLLGQGDLKLRARTALEQQLGYRFASSKQFEESLSDLVGLAYARATHPAQYEEVLTKVKTVRKNFASRNPEHDSSAVLSVEWIDWADQWAQTLPAPVREEVATLSATTVVDAPRTGIKNQLVD